MLSRQTTLADLAPLTDVRYIPADDLLRRRALIQGIQSLLLVEIGIAVFEWSMYRFLESFESPWYRLLQNVRQNVDSKFFIKDLLATSEDIPRRSEARAGSLRKSI